jgi:pyruvate/2-oxoglutarate dehydrogenase complex dihydrolipoamide dehydrogenase (E3) component
MARYQFVVIGAGPAGVVAAMAAAARGVRVALVERRLIGGTCLNTGCIPSKAIIRTSRLYAEMRDATRYGALVPDGIRVDFAAVMARVRRIRAHLSSRSSVEQLRAAGVDVIIGEACFADGNTVTVNGEQLHFTKALIATGTRPRVPEIPGLQDAGFLTNENVFDLTELPRRLLVIGGGPVGCELAQAFCRLGARTTIVQDKPLFLPAEERDAAQILSEAFARDGLEVRLNTKAVRVRRENGQTLVDLVSDDYRSTIAVDAILTGSGRSPNVERLNLEVADVEFETRSGIRVDDSLRTSNRHIYAAGDVCLEHQYGHTAAVSARMAVRNALFRGRDRWSALVIPWCTFTDPEIAHVGLYVRDANRQGIPVKTFTIPMHDVDRAIADSEDTGFVKIHVHERTGRILGATIVARHAGDLINEITLAMVAGLGLRTLARAIHAYDTQAEAIGTAAAAYGRTADAKMGRAR